MYCNSSSKQRNREHARSTRMRRKVFENVLQRQFNSISRDIETSINSDYGLNYTMRKKQRYRSLASFCLLMVGDLEGYCRHITLYIIVMFVVVGHQHGALSSCRHTVPLPSSIHTIGIRVQLAIFRLHL